jgi:hypothetical protein
MPSAVCPALIAEAPVPVFARIIGQNRRSQRFPEDVPRPPCFVGKTSRIQGKACWVKPVKRGCMVVGRAVWMDQDHVDCPSRRVGRRNPCRVGRSRIAIHNPPQLHFPPVRVPLSKPLPRPQIHPPLDLRMPPALHDRQVVSGGQPLCCLRKSFCNASPRQSRPRVLKTWPIDS